MCVLYVYLHIFTIFIVIRSFDVILTALPRSGGYHMENGGMPLPDAVGINSQRGTTTENKGSGVKYMG